LNTSSFAKQVLGSKTPGRKRLNSLIVALVKLTQQANHAGRLNKPLGGKMKKEHCMQKKYFVERLCDVDDCTLGPLVNEFVFAK